jgi:hypothetical protein
VAQELRLFRNKLRVSQRFTPHIPSLPDERIPEEKTRFVLVVRATAQLDVVGRASTSRCVGRDVVELEEPSLAAPARPSDERTASLIALPHFTPDSGRYVTSGCSAHVRTRSW